MDINYYDDIKLLGFHMPTNIQESAKKKIMGSVVRKISRTSTGSLP